MTSTETARADYIAGLRAIADLLESTPDLPLPTTRKIEWAAHWYTSNDDEIPAVVADLARRIPGKLTKNDPTRGAYAAAYYELSGNVGGMPVRVWAERSAVCERVVTGTREVVETVPAPDAPMVEVVKTVEDFEWVCHPILAEATA